MREKMHPVKHFWQPDGHTCVAACLKMMLHYRQKNIPVRTVARGIHTTQTGTDFIYAALYAAKLGTNPTLFYFDPSMIPSWYQSPSQRAWQKNLARRAQHGWPWKHLQEIVHCGGVYHPQHLPIKALKDLLRREPIIVSVESSYFSTLKGTSVRRMKHAIVLVDQDFNHMYYLDPQEKEVQRVSWEIFEIAYYFCGGEALYF